ncbi:MAG: hypothetical protein ACK50E_03000 [Bacteroidota bacterium]|jgi:hypothetical protein
MKHLSFTLICMFSVIGSFAQYFTDIEWQKQKFPAVQISIAFSQEITEDAIKIEMGKLGYSPSQEKGGLLYKAVKLIEIGPDSYDILFKVQKKGRKESESADVYMAVSRGNNNYVAPNDSDGLPAAVKKFTEQFPVWAEKQSLEVEIKEQDDKLKGAQKKLQSLTDEGVQLEKKLQKLQQDISENKQLIEKQKAEVNIQAKFLEELMKKRKN